MCDKRLRTAESLLEHFSLDHGITLWKVSEDIKEENKDKHFLDKDETADINDDEEETEEEYYYEKYTDDENYSEDSRDKIDKLLENS